MKKIILGLFSLFGIASFAQSNIYWQQHVDYTMDIDMDVHTFKFEGKQKLVYTNNSPDVLDKVFYHLQLNAFQPGSQMDMRLQHIADPDGRMVNKSGTKENPIIESRIAKLQPNEIGYQKIISLKQDGKPVKYEVYGTILKVMLNQPILAGKKVTFEMEFEAQVPLQIRRNGRNSKDNVALSMAQWYPKLAEYDTEGWQVNQYIAREFYGVWGDFDVTIHIDKNYTIGGTGYLQNPQEVGHGYEDTTKKLRLPKGDKLTWHFKAPNVHDFTWAADPAYIHDTKKVPNGATLHFLYKNNPGTVENWKKMQEEAVKTMQFYNEYIGPYPYKQYSIIQGGDGGMEYGMSTLIAGGSKLGSLVGTMRHEMGHAWFQFTLANNEIKHGWMDEGFTSYISSLAKAADKNDPAIFASSYRRYNYIVSSGKEEPLTTQADRFEINTAYSIASYTKGSIFLSQLGYVIGQENLHKTLKKYYADFKMKHPNPNDIKRTAEKVSGLELNWYLNEWTETTHTIDYAISSVTGKVINLERIGRMPMPIDLSVTYVDGTTEDFYIPLTMMYGTKPTKATIVSSWDWANPKYTLTTTKAVKKVEIDPSKLMADIDQNNNVLEVN